MTAGARRRRGAAPRLAGAATGVSVPVAACGPQDAGHTAGAATGPRADPAGSVPTARAPAPDPPADGPAPPAPPVPPTLTPGPDVPRSPASVPDAPEAVGAGLDTDGDDRPDTVLTLRSGELLVHTDLDGDGLADQVLALGPGGGVRLHGPGGEDELWLD